MVRYTFSCENPSQQYVQIQAIIPVEKEETIINLPCWRPGRYELANFAKNIKNFKVYNEEKKTVEFHKTSKDTWLVDSRNTDKIIVEYSYYANELNAGSTFFDNSQLYVNPVNCAVFTEETKHLKVEVLLNIPSTWQVASSMRKEDNVLTVENFEEFVDSPFVCSANLQFDQYEERGILFHVWFNGIVKPDWSRLIKDFKAFTQKQLEKFKDFPSDEFHFIIQILPYKTYHGVEHQKSTVITLGPSYDVFKGLYKELLGVSSHELYHAWNVKSIRPAEMLPYDFTKENYSSLGYVYEGVTTYMGDLFLYKSGVFNLDQYLLEFNTQLQKHFDNPGRFNYSVAESSFDTWLDGYVQGAPGRKVSIYTEGCLLAFVSDVMILKATKNQFSLDTVMKRLYFDFYKKDKGITEEDYKSVLENVSGISFDEIFKDFINGNRPFESIITEALEYIGLELHHSPVAHYSQGRLGFKALPSLGNSSIVKQIYPGGPADLGGVMLEDEVISINGISLNRDLDQWLEYFDDDLKKLLVLRKGQVVELLLPEVDRNFYMQYTVRPLDKMNTPQLKAFEAWSK
jgi:predicted metalloprotease with PDZ domain